MKKLIISLVALLASVSLFADTATIAAGATTATFTNDGPHNLVYIENVAVVSGTATNDTVQVLVTKGAVDYQVATISITTNSAYGNVIVTNPVPIGNDGVWKVKRAVTNFTLNVYTDVR